MRICASCSHPNSINRNICVACAEPLIRHCSSCGTHNTSNNERCNLCGEPLNIVARAPVSHSPNERLQELLPAMLNVVVLPLGGVPTWFSFDKHEISFGGSPESDVFLPDANLERQHALLVFQKRRYVLLAAKSHNGVYVNGEAVLVSPAVSLEDVIQIKQYTIRMVETYYDLEQLGIRVPMDELSDGPAPSPRMDAVEFHFPS